MIAVENLTKAYGSVVAVSDLSFEVQQGEVVGFLGPNGAGKTTTLRILSGFLGATRGRVVVANHDIVDEPLKARESIGYMPENAPQYPELRVEEYLRFRAELKRVPRNKRKESVVRSMRDVRIEDHADTLIGQLSKGYRQRLGLADAIVARPPVLILDEPTAGLDPNQIREARELIRSLAADHTVLFSTHILSEVETMCDRALVIDRGRLVAQGALDDLRKLRRAPACRLTVRGEKAEQLLAKLDEVRDVEVLEKGDDAITLELRWSDRVEDTAGATEGVIEKLIAAGHHVREAVASKTSLEEVFALLTEDVATQGPSSSLEEKGP